VIRHLTLPDVLALHAYMMERMGSHPAPLRGGGEAILDSAIHRPINAAAYEGADLIRQAALLAVGISQAQAFLDGNKRTAYFCADVFLRANGLRFSGDPLVFADELLRVIERSTDLPTATAHFEAWLREHVSPNP
jgi:death-on-curing protein